jgi:hypothetical protein
MRPRLGRPLCTIDRCSDIVEDPPAAAGIQIAACDLEQRTIEEAGYTIAVLRSGDLRKIVVVRAGNQP